MRLSTVDTAVLTVVITCMAYVQEWSVYLQHLAGMLCSNVATQGIDTCSLERLRSSHWPKTRNANYATPSHGIVIISCPSMQPVTTHSTSLTSLIRLNAGCRVSTRLPTWLHLRPLTRYPGVLPWSASPKSSQALKSFCKYFA